MKNIKKFGIISILILMIGFVFLVNTAFASNLYVDNDANPVWYDATHVKTIQEGIDNSSNGDTVNVLNGTYNENIVVNKSIIIISTTGALNTTINASNPSNHVVKITVDNVTLDNFTITGLASSSQNIGSIITWGVDNCTIKNNILTNNYADGINLYEVNNNYSNYNIVSNNVITTPNQPSGGGGFAIKIKGSNNIIDGNIITDGWRWAIHLWSYDTSEIVSPDYNTISNNTITGTGAYDERGIVCKTGAYTKILNNDISNIIYAPIYFYTSDRIVGETNFDPRPNHCTISNNEITGGETGIALLEGCNNFTISDNTITGSTVEGKITQVGILAGLSRWLNDWVGKTLAYTGDSNHLNYLQVNDNIISGNTINNCGHGIAMQYADRNTITYNVITNNINILDVDWWSINPELDFVADYAGVFLDANSEGNVVNYNNIADNTGGLKNANTLVTLDARYNYWGDYYGCYHPTENPEGGGNAVSDNVLFDPWYTDMGLTNLYKDVRLTEHLSNPTQILLVGVLVIVLMLGLVVYVMKSFKEGTFKFETFIKLLIAVVVITIAFSFL